MKIKALVIAAMLVVAAVALVGCAPAPTAPVATATPAPTATATPVATATPAPVDTATPAPAVTTAAVPAQLELTVDELAAYNGKDGKPAYVAVNGVIYDVTNNRAWQNGAHQGYNAGMDLTDALGKAPHGDSVLKDLPVVGKLK